MKLKNLNLIPKPVLFVCFCIFFHVSENYAQFAPPGAKWYCTVQNLNERYVDYGTVTYVHDTTINGQTWKALKFQPYNDSGNAVNYHKYYIVRQDSFIVRIWMGTFASVLYNFSPNQKIRDTLIYKDSSGHKVLLGVFKIDSVLIAGQPHTRIQYGNYRSPYNSWTVIDPVGGSTFLPEFLGSAFPRNISTRCYSDSNLSYVWPDQYKCDSTVHVGIAEDVRPENQWIVYPNPAQTVIYFQNRNNSFLAAQSIEITDLSGRVLYAEVLPAGDIDISYFKPGVYILKIFSNQYQYFYKILKN